MVPAAVVEVPAARAADQDPDPAPGGLTRRLTSGRLPLDTSRSLAAVLASAVAFYGLFIWRTAWVSRGQLRFTLFDDAMISMTYARTFAEGGGLVWYPGAPRVEGFTNPLWVFLMAALHRLGLSGSGVALAVMFLGVACLLGSAIMAVAVFRRLGTGRRWAEPLVAGLVAFCYPLVYWTLRGMEVGLVTFLTLTAVWLALVVDEQLRDHRPTRRTVAFLSAVLAAGLVTRIDFVVVAAVVVAWSAWRSRGRGVRAVVLPLSITTVAVLGLQSIARLWYYGSLTPNTYALKAEGVPLFDRLERGGWVALIIGLTTLLPAALLIVAAVRRRLGRTGPALLPLAIIAALLGYSTYVGGDAWEWMAYANRYLVPAVALLLVVATSACCDLMAARGGAPGIRRPIIVAVGIAPVTMILGLLALQASGLALDKTLEQLGTGVAGMLVLALLGAGWFAARKVGMLLDGGRDHRAAILCMVTLAVASSLFPVVRWADNAGAYVEADTRNVESGALLRAMTGPDAEIAVVGVGAIAYYSERPILDQLGKNDRHIAEGPSRGEFLPGHSKWDAAYSIERLRPDIVFQVWRPTPALYQLLRDSGYVEASVLLEPDQAWLGGPADGPHLYVRTDSTAVDWSRLVIEDQPAG